MGKTCLGCGKPMGGIIGAYGVRVLYGEVCLTCNKKLNVIPSYQYLTPSQIKDVISGRVSKADVRAQAHIASSDAGHSKPASLSPAEEIRQYKELYDDGIISHEEFEAVKKRLLNI